MTTPYGYGPPSGEDGSGHDPQPWDPAYPHPPAGAQPHQSPYGYGFGYGGYGSGGSGYGYGYGGQPGQYGQYGRPGYPPVAPPPAPRGYVLRSGLISVLVAAVVAALVVLVAGTSRTVTGSAVAGGGPAGTAPSTTPGRGTPGTLPRQGGGPSLGKASAAQQVGVVDIYTEQKYDAAAAAGTGIVLTADGDVLTNNHVVYRATSIKVRVVSTDQTYAARVVGTAPTKDVAVIRLIGASGLQPASLGDSGSVSLGDKVVGVGNAGGIGGVPSAASGQVTALHRTITASDETGTNPETLHDIIVTDAPIKSGDSGGPLYDAGGRVIGMDTAASTHGASTGFAIPVNNALSLAEQIEKGIRTSSIHIGYPAFLGVQLVPSGSGALVQDAVPDTPAARAGISSGDLITAVDGTRIATGAQLHNVISTRKPGARVSITYTDPNTGSHTVRLTLITGPAD